MQVVLVGTGVEPIPPTGYGGVERSLAEYAGALRRAGHSVRLVQTVRRRRSIDEYWFAWELGALTLRAGEEVLHASTPVVANRLAQRHLPYVYTTHSRHWFQRTSLTDRWGAFLERRAVARSFTTIALTPRLAEAIAHQLPAGSRPPTPVIPLGVDSERFRPGDTPGDPTIALGVGAVIPAKRWSVAAAALRGTRLRLRLVGPTPDPGLARRISESGPVDVLGEISEDQLLREYQGAGMLLHPSGVELLPGVVLQAFACGLPVLGGPALAGLIRDGVDGQLLPGPDPAHPGLEIDRWRTAAVALAEADDRRRAWGRAARDRARTEFNWASVVERHLPIYQQLLDRPPLPRKR
ncbi:MAG: glycosyltransferase family 4 protein [Thermoplasmata archaeon]